MTNIHRKRDLTFLHLLVMVVFMFGGQFLEPIEPITPYGMKVLGIFIGLLYGWSLAGMLWPSLLGLIALGVTGCVDSIQTAAASAMGNYMVVNCIFIFVVVELLSASGLINHLCGKIMTSNFIKGHEWRLFTVILFIPFILSAVGQVFTAVFLGWKIVYAILDIAGYERTEKISVILLVGSVMAIAAGSQVLPFLSSALIVCGAFSSIINESFNYGRYMLFSIPFAIICFVEIVLIFKFIFRPDVSKLRAVDVNQLQFLEVSDKMDRRQKISGIAFALLVLLLVIGSLLPKDSLGAIIYNKFNVGGAALFICLLLMLIKVDGKPILEFKDLASSGLSWDLMFFLGVVLYISNFLSSPDTGIAAAIALIMKPLLSLKSGFAFTVVFLVIAAIITQFMNNTVTAIIFLPVLMVAGETYGLNNWAMATLLIASSQFIAYATPAACPNSGMMYSNEYTPYKKAIKYVLPILLVWLVTLVSIGTIIANLAF